MRPASNSPPDEPSRVGGEGGGAIQSRRPHHSAQSGPGRCTVTIRNERQPFGSPFHRTHRVRNRVDDVLHISPLPSVRTQ